MPSCMAPPLTCMQTPLPPAGHQSSGSRGQLSRAPPPHHRGHHSPRHQGKPCHEATCAFPCRSAIPAAIPDVIAQLFVRIGFNSRPNLAQSPTLSPKPCHRVAQSTGARPTSGANREVTQTRSLSFFLISGACKSSIRSEFPSWSTAHFDWSCVHSVIVVCRSDGSSFIFFFSCRCIRGPQGSDRTSSVDHSDPPLWAMQNRPRWVKTRGGEDRYSVFFDSIRMEDSDQEAGGSSYLALSRPTPTRGQEGRIHTLIPENHCR